MAATAITPTALTLNGSVALPATAALDGTDGGIIDFTGVDDKIAIIVENSDSTNAETFTIKAGNALQGTVDLVESIAKSTTKVYVIESGLYKNISGANKDKVVVTGSADVKVAAILLP